MDEHKLITGLIEPSEATRSLCRAVAIVQLPLKDEGFVVILRGSRQISTLFIGCNWEWDIDIETLLDDLTGADVLELG
ncbi:hypothetical protein [Halocatena marina]|uniref:Uncharacterized protein n=1 Tax=Halocatena marina TaxID=2934937 RepID=A0ABD5YXE4_9EURY|nr:hypothetical protein [Halocatena marina]